MKMFKKLAPAALVVLAISTIAGTALAMDDEPAKLACFQAHHGLMDKPAVQNVEACWRAHGYQMQQ